MAIKELSARDRILTAARELVADRGFASTSVDAVLQRAEASKGAFFHHFPSKGQLGRALVDDYVADDIAFLDALLARAERRTADAGDQLRFVVSELQALGGLPITEQPACLMVSFIYENQLDVAGIGESVLRSILYWRQRLTELLERASPSHPKLRDVDLPALADNFFTTIEGAFLLSRATGEPDAFSRQVGQLRSHIELLLESPDGSMP